MKSKLAVFFAGFTAGLLVAFLVIGLAPDRPQSQRTVSRPMFIYNGDTNATVRWKQLNAASSLTNPP